MRRRHQYADGGKVKKDWLDRAEEAGAERAARGIAHANQIGKGRQPKRDLPFAAADTATGLAQMGVAGAANGIRDAVRKKRK